MLVETLAAMTMMSGAEMPTQERGAPRGDYRDSCSGEYVNRGRLYADCRTRRNDIRATSIELARCSSYEIRNTDGILTCGPYRGDDEGRPGGGGYPGGPGGGWNPGGPGGGWNGGRQSITVYRDSNYRGQALQFNGPVPNLRNSGMNDAISSFQLRGSWELCTDANFGGRCTLFDGDQNNLARWQLNDSISSLRPARRGGR
jgi:hypothetical protein